MTEEYNRREADHQHTRHETRLDRLEGVVEGLATNQARAEATMGNLVTSVDRLSEAFTQSQARQTESSKTNWGVIASWASVLIILLGLVIYQPMREQQASIAKIVEWQRTYEVRSEGRNVQQTTEHKAIDEKIEHNHKQIHKYADVIDDVVKDTVQHDSRLLNLERLVFPDAKYKDGKPH